MAMARIKLKNKTTIEDANEIIKLSDHFFKRLGLDCTPIKPIEEAIK